MKKRKASGGSLPAEEQIKMKRDPKRRILDVAEKVFASQGFDAASIRSIAAGVGVNLPTIYYHFGSKLGLIQAVLDRRTGSLQQEHLALLERYDQEAGGVPLSMEKILEAMLLPPLRIAASDSPAHAIVMQLIGRIMEESSEEMQEMFLARHRKVKEAFYLAFARSLPELPPCDLRWRYEFAWGLLGSVLLRARLLAKETRGVCDPLDTPAILAQMIALLAAGFRAPATPRPCPVA